MSQPRGGGTDGENSPSERAGQPNYMLLERRKHEGTADLYFLNIILPVE